MIRRHPWTPERVEQLTKLWADPSLTCSAIGRIMHLSVSAVTGKRYHLKLPSRESPIRPAGSGVYPRHLRPKVETPDAVPEAPDAAPTSEAPDVVPEPPGPRGCQFISGDVRKRGWSFCDKPGFPWCEEHRRKVFDKAPRVHGYDRL